MRVMDKSGPQMPGWPKDFDWSVITYPARGYMPTRFIRSDVAWHVSVNSRKFKLGAVVKVNVYPVKRMRSYTGLLKRASKPLPIDNFSINRAAFGTTPAIIFSPRGAVIRNGAAYWVEILGVTSTTGNPVKLEYFVEFAG